MRKIARICIPILLILGSLPVLNLAMFHAWAAGGPPTPNPEWHEMWANIFLCVWIAILLVAGFSIYLFRPRQMKRGQPAAGDDWKANE